MNTSLFDAYSIPLKGSNLIEASAGTGKTYSIAILCLRLIVEKNIPIDQQLMVTFTQNAVAELEVRIRKFIRVAQQQLDNGSREKDMESVHAWIDQLLENKKFSSDSIASSLAQALESLDRIPVMTIHKFCRKVLNDFAIECQHMYDQQIIEDLDEIIQQEVENYWRKYISTLDPLLLQLLMPANQKKLKDLHLDNLVEFIKKCLSGKKWMNTVVDPQQLLRQIKEYAHYFNQKDWTTFLDNRYQTKIKQFSRNKCDQYLEYCNDLVTFLSKADQNTALFNKVFESEIAWLNELRILVQHFKNNCFNQAFQLVVPAIQQQLNQKKLLSHDQSILDVYQVISPQHSSNQQAQHSLINGLNKQYRAVFVDEFQDTDRYQYEIFHRIFASKSACIFFIGDPKQSIYAWRQADLNTYLKARENCKINQMHINYRSSSNYVKSMNTFFAPNPSFDAFYQHNIAAKQRINYQPVLAKLPTETINLDQQSLNPLNLIDAPYKQETIVEQTAQLVLALLKEGRWHNNNKKIEAQDISILVRNNQQATLIDNALQALNIPSQTSNNADIYTSVVAPYILYILEAWHARSLRKLNKAIINPLTGFVWKDLQNIDKNLLQNYFQGYLKSWLKKGIYPALMQYFADFNCAEQLMKSGRKNAKRCLSDYYQLAETLHEVSLTNKYSAAQLIDYLKASIAGLNSNEVALQRPISEQAAVQLLTVHKSKGLEFKIVIAPFLDLKTTQKSLFREFRNKAGDYCFCTKQQLEYQSLWTEQLEQENRRLIYVALTRAKYASFVFKNKSNSSLSPFFEALKIQQPSSIQSFEQIVGKIDLESPYSQPTQLSTPLLREVSDKFTLSDRYYRSMSYSYLAGAHQYHSKPIADKQYPSESYEHFIFNVLPRGIQAGEMLHNLFEWIDWTSTANDSWSATIEMALQKYGFSSNTKMMQIRLAEMIEKVTHGLIKFKKNCFKLASIQRQKRRIELEFNFKASAFTIDNLSSLESYLPSGFRIHHRQSEHIEGKLNGFIDLFFEKDNKYYILDWKSNYLGDQLENYHKDALIKAMSENNYHLQYLIYSLAVHKYLQLKLANYRYEKDFGGVIYVFLRGVRPEKQDGFFCYKPTKACIQRLEEIFS